MVLNFIDNILSGTGSVLHQAGDIDESYAQAEMAGNNAEMVLQALSKLKLRLFTGHEIAALLGKELYLFFTINGFNKTLCK